MTVKTLNEMTASEFDTVLAEVRAEHAKKYCANLPVLAVGCRDLTTGFEASAYNPEFFVNRAVTAADQLSWAATETCAKMRKVTMVDWTGELVLPTVD